MSPNKQLRLLLGAQLTNRGRRTAATCQSSGLKWMIDTSFFLMLDVNMLIVLYSSLYKRSGRSRLTSPVGFWTAVLKP